MEQQEAVKVLEVCLIEPPQETITSSTPTSLPLTFFDLLWLRFLPVERLFFYEFPNPTATYLFFDSILPNLKHSLSLTLQHFLPLTGNITWPHDSPHPIITYVPGDDAVPFTIAESNSNFNHPCSNLCEAEKRSPLIPHLTTSHEKASVLSLQVTLFPKFGFCIGITTHHAAMDGKSSTLFMKAWAYTCSNLIQSSSPSPSPSSFSSLHENLTPFFDRSVIKDPKGIAQAYVDAWLKQGGPNNRSLKVWESINNTMISEAVKGLFELTPSHIQKLKQHAQSKLKMKVKYLSTFSVTCAFVLTCLVKSEQPKAKRVIYIFGVDCRTRLDPPIVATYFGNCVIGRVVEIGTEKLLENDGFIHALEGICEALVRIEDGILNGAEKRVLNMHAVTEDRRISTAGSPKFEVYGIDFGWGRPKKVDMTSIDRTGAFSLSESRNHNRGIEIGLTLNKHQMEVFNALFVQGLQSF